MPTLNTYWLWWEPPEGVGREEYPAGVWVIEQQLGDDPPHCGATVDAGPVDASTDWLAVGCACAPDALVRESDIEIGIYARRADGNVDHDRVERWFPSRRYSFREMSDTTSDTTSAAPVEIG
jgi:hypothetical protein